MYIELVKKVLTLAVKSHTAATGKKAKDVLKEIREHIDATQDEHFCDDPDISYSDALCRLGYLYRHATANATLFQRVLEASPELRAKVKAANAGKLHVCAVGGGPGTELLGLAKFLMNKSKSIPRKITFTVLDRVPEWAETWKQLADATEDELRTVLADDKVEPPTVAPMFLPLEVLDAKSYASFAYQFSDADVVVFNYLFSENKARLAKAQAVLTHLKKVTPPGCVFVVIDRHEANGKFTEQVCALFKGAGFVPSKVAKISGTVDRDEQTDDMGEILTECLGRPRVKFFTAVNRDATVFWFTAVRA